VFSVTTFLHNKVIDTAVPSLSQLGCNSLLPIPSNPRSVLYGIDFPTLNIFTEAESIQVY